MTAKTTITLTDHATTGAGPSAEAHAFTPEHVEDGYIHTFGNPDTGSTGASRSTLKIGIRRANAQRKYHKVFYELKRPVTHTVDGIERVAFVDKKRGEYIIHEDSDAANRLDLLDMSQDIYADTGFRTMVGSLEDFY